MLHECLYFTKINWISFQSYKTFLNVEKNTNQLNEITVIWDFLKSKNILLDKKDILSEELALYNSLQWFQQQKIVSPVKKDYSYDQLKNIKNISSYLHKGSRRTFSLNHKLNKSDKNNINTFVAKYHLFSPSAWAYYPIIAEIFYRDKGFFISEKKQIDINEINKHFTFSDNIDFLNCQWIIVIDFDSKEITSKYWYKSYKLASIEAGYLLSQFSSFIKHEFWLEWCILWWLTHQHIDNRHNKSIIPLCWMVFWFDK